MFIYICIFSALLYIILTPSIKKLQSFVQVEADKSSTEQNVEGIAQTGTVAGGQNAIEKPISTCKQYTCLACDPIPNFSPLLNNGHP